MINTVAIMIGTDRLEIIFIMLGFIVPTAIQIIALTIRTKNLFLKPSDSALSTIPINVPAYAPEVTQAIKSVDAIQIM